MREQHANVEAVKSSDSNWVGTDQQFRILWWLISVTLVLNVLDAIFTLNWVQRGQAQEANPLMDIIISNPVLFVCVKMSLVNLGCYLLWQRHRRPHESIHKDHKDNPQPTLQHGTQMSYLSKYAYRILVMYVIYVICQFSTILQFYAWMFGC